MALSPLIWLWKQTSPSRTRAGHASMLKWNLNLPGPKRQQLMTSSRFLNVFFFFPKISFAARQTIFNGRAMAQWRKTDSTTQFWLFPLLIIWFNSTFGESVKFFEPSFSRTYRYVHAAHDKNLLVVGRRLFNFFCKKRRKNILKMSWEIQFILEPDEHWTECH